MINLLENLQSAESHQERRQARNAQRIWIAVFCGIVFAGVSTRILMDWTGNPRHPFAPIVFVNFGLLVAGPFICAMFLTLPALTIGARITGSLVALVILVFAGVIGNARESDFYELFDFQDLVVGPIWLIGLCLPFGIMRSVMGWQIWVPYYDQPNDRPRLTIAGMMVVTALVAISMSVLRFGQPHHLQVGGWGAVIASGLSLCLVPVIAGLMYSRNYMRWWIGVAAVMVPLGLVICMLLLSMDFWMAGCIMVTVIASYFAITAPLIGVRVYGGKLFDKSLNHQCSDQPIPSIVLQPVDNASA